MNLYIVILYTHVQVCMYILVNKLHKIIFILTGTFWCLFYFHFFKIVVFIHYIDFTIY